MSCSAHEFPSGIVELRWFAMHNFGTQNCRKFFWAHICIPFVGCTGAGRKLGWADFQFTNAWRAFLLWQRHLLRAHQQNVASWGRPFGRFLGYQNTYAAQSNLGFFLFFTQSRK